MISQFYSKEDDLKKENAFSKFNNNLIQKMSLISYFAGENVVVGHLLATICLFATYSKYLGTICFFLRFQGIAENPFNILIKIFSQTSFFMNHELIYQVIILFFFFFNLIYLFSFILIAATVTSKDNKMILFSIIRLYQLMNIINFWLFLSFELELSMCVLLKFTPSEQSMFYQALSGINIVMTLFIALIYCLFGNKVEYNFELCDYFSRLDTLYEFLVLLEKVLISVIYIVRIGITFDENIYLSICLVIVTLMTLALTNYSFYYYNYTNMLLLYFNLCTIYAVMVSLICYNIKTINGGDFWICAGYLTLYPVSKFIITFYWNRLLSKIPFVEIKQEHVLCKYMLMLIYLVCVENLNEVQRLKLIGVVKQHQQNCVFEGCVCKEENGEVLYIPKTETEYVIQNEDFSYENSKIYIKHLVKKEFEFLIKVTRNSNINLIMMYSYYMFYYIGNYYTSMYALLNLKKNKNLNYQQKSSLHRIFEMIHHKIESINSGPMKRHTPEGTTYFKVDFNRIILYYEKVTKLKSAITLALEYSTQFWTCIQNRVEIHLIKKNGLEFFKYHSLIEEAYREINQIYDSLEEVNNYYARYKASVFNEQTKLLFPSGSSPSSSSAPTPMQNQFKSQEDSIQENEKYYHLKCVIVIANLTDKNKAIIEKISENIKGLLNYTPTECLSQDAKLLMPNIYKATHSFFIQSHFETGRNLVVNHEKTTFALHANNYSIPIMISIKMLPNYSDNVYYVGVLREIPIDYDFIITTPNGKIEMISKGIFNKLFNSSNIQLFNSIDYYINFICREYFEEIAKIYSEDYQLTNFMNENAEQKEYKYTLLHFKSDITIDNTLREYKKNENTQNNMYNQSNRQSMLEAPILKILQMKEKIMSNFNRESIKKYVKIEQYQVFLDQYLFCFKLYSNINSDGLVNLDEVKLIDKYIQKKEDDVDDPKKPFRLLYSMLEPNEIKQRNINVKEYNDEALGKGKLYLKAQQKEKAGQFVMSNQKAKFDKEQLKAYLSMKKSYSKKKEYTQVKYALLYNIIFLIGMIICVSLNYLTNEKEILDIFDSLNTEYFTFLPLYLNLAIINKNYDLFLIKDDFFQNRLPYLEQLYKYTDDATRIISKSLIDMTLLTFHFSNDFLNQLNQEVALQRPFYPSTAISLKNAIVTFASEVNTIYSIDQVNKSNINVQMLLMNLNNEFYAKFETVFNLSLNATNAKVQELIRAKQIFIWVLMAMVLLFGCYLYTMILCFYCEQNRMIAMLLSIDIDECDAILGMIRELKLTSQKNKINEDANEHQSSINNKGSGNEENERLLNDNNNLVYEIRKAVNEDANKRKKSKKKKKGVPNINNSISKEIIITFLLRIILLILFNLSPFIYSVSQTFFIGKCEKIIDLIQNYNKNQFAFLTSFLLFEKIAASETPSVALLERLNEVLLSMKTNQFESTNKLFDTLDGFTGQERFEAFFARNFCSSITQEHYCNSTSPYNHQSFLYITNINLELIDDMLRNTKAAGAKTKQEIEEVLHDRRYAYADETFNLMSVYGFNQLTTFIQEMITTFISSYNQQIVIVFALNIILMFLNQLISIWLLKYIIEAVDVELKNIFSLMPFPLALEDANIKELLSK